MFALANVFPFLFGMVFVVRFGNAHKFVSFSDGSASVFVCCFFISIDMNAVKRIPTWIEHFVHASRIFSTYSFCWRWLIRLTFYSSSLDCLVELNATRIPNLIFSLIYLEMYAARSIDMDYCSMHLRVCVNSMKLLARNDENSLVTLVHRGI